MSFPSGCLPAPLALVAVSEKGASLAARIAEEIPQARVFVLEKYAAQTDGATADITPFGSTGELAASLWPRYKGIVFLCASGIAVRAIAPLVASKFTDPAVVVCADTGAFSFSLLSGHEGGANTLAEKIAECVNKIGRGGGRPLPNGGRTAFGSVPVITTASESSPSITPRNLFAGVGCKRGMAADNIISFIEAEFAEQRISPRRIRALCTIDIKKDEAGLAAAADYFEAPLLCFSAEELNSTGGSFAASAFVRGVTGTDNVCERAAARAGGRGRLIIPKTARNGITLSVFERE